jgi:hypothetical protein
MLVSFIPGATDVVASARIRVYSMLNPLRKLGIDTEIGYSAAADVLVVQKRLNPTILGLARDFKASGGLLVYDCEDLGRALAYWTAEDCLREMFSLAHLVTTNTDEFRTAFEGLYGARSVEVIPDIVDYYLTAPQPLAGRVGSALRVLWFGNVTNLVLLQPYLMLFQNLPSCCLIVCTSDPAPALLLSYNDLQFVRWSLPDFPALLRSVHLTFLPHGTESSDRSKSNNRMITSIAWGVPAIVSRTPAYERTATHIGVSNACFDNIKEAGECIERYRSSVAREQYLSVAQPIIWREHSPEAVAAQWWEIISQYEARL